MIYKYAMQPFDEIFFMCPSFVLRGIACCHARFTVPFS